MSVEKQEDADTVSNSTVARFHFSDDPRNSLHS